MEPLTIPIAHSGIAQRVFCKSAMGWVADLHVGAAIKLRPVAVLEFTAPWLPLVEPNSPSLSFNSKVQALPVARF
jgi:hypothetical protein